jgi:replicative DNA helicase
MSAVALQPVPDTLTNLELECELLGSLMVANQNIDRAADLLSAADFSEPMHGRIFSAIVSEASKGRDANPITLRGYFQDDPSMTALGGPVYLMRLTGGVTGMLAEECAKGLADLSRRRSMRDGLQGAADSCADLTIPPADIAAQADEAISTTARDHIHQPTGGQCFDELIDGFRESQSGITCRQIPCLDELHGPMRPKQLVIGAARPGMGKTAVALSYAIGAARSGHGVLFVSLEMSSCELAARMAADMCFNGNESVPFSAIRDGRLNDWQMRKVTEAGSRMHGLPLNVIDAGHLTIGRLSMLVRRHARRMEANGHRLELVVVDYLQLLSPDARSRSSYEAVSEVSRGLKALAKDQNVAVFALAQLSREVEKRTDKRPQLSDLRDSGQIEQDADSVLFLLREEYYLRQSVPDQMDPNRMAWEDAMRDSQGKIEFILAKRRNGTVGTAIGSFYGAYQAVRG